MRVELIFAGCFHLMFSIDHNSVPQRAQLLPLSNNSRAQNGRKSPLLQNPRQTRGRRLSAFSVKKIGRSTTMSLASQLKRVHPKHPRQSQHRSKEQIQNSHQHLKRARLGILEKLCVERRLDK